TLATKPPEPTSTPARAAEPDPAREPAAWLAALTPPKPREVTPVLTAPARRHTPEPPPQFPY
ncbi:MAG TPA: hypothetical protein VFZ32_16845, partial [Micromonosporaceae bacterium]